VKQALFDLKIFVFAFLAVVSSSGCAAVPAAIFGICPGGSPEQREAKDKAVAHGVLADHFRFINDERRSDYHAEKARYHEWKAGPRNWIEAVIHIAAGCED
jgi:hypothetical protein